MIPQDILAKLSGNTESNKDLSVTESSASNTSKQTTPSPVPSVGQPDKDKGAGTKTTTTQQQSSQQSTDNKTDTVGNKTDTVGKEDIAKKAKEKLGLKTVEPKTAEFWKSKYEASSKEGREKARQFALLAESLKKFGVTPIMRDDKVEFVPDENYVTLNSTSLATEVTKNLSDEEKGLAGTDTETFARIIAERLLRLTARPVPTIKKEDISISSQEVSQIVEKISKLPEYSAYSDYIEYIESVLDDEATPQTFKKWMLQSSENYEFGLKLLYDRVDRYIAPLVNEYKQLQAEKEKKRKQAEGDISLLSQGHHSGASVKSTQDIPLEIQELINARNNYLGGR